MTECVCPVCAARFPWETASTDSHARAAFGLLASLPAIVAAMLPQYVGLFRQASGALHWAVVRTLVSDLIDRHGAEIKARPQVWARAMAYLVGQRNRPDCSITWPLTGHGVLLRVVEREQREAPAAQQQPAGPRTVQPVEPDPVEDRQRYLLQFRGREELLEGTPLAAEFQALVSQLRAPA